MKLNTNEYTLRYLSVELPVPLATSKNIRHLQNHAIDEYARLKDGIEVNYDNLSELEANKDGEIDDTLVQLASYLLNNWKHIDTFIFTP